MNRLLEEWLALLFPQRNICHGCGTPLVQEEGLLCVLCQQKLNDYAFTHGRAETVIDAEIDCAASAFRYQGTAAQLVKTLKFRADQSAAAPLAEGMAQTYANLSELHTVEFCVAVPVHYKRLRRRGYNQAEVLTTAFSELVGVPVAPEALVRLHHKRSQVGQGRTARMGNVAGAFAVSTAGRAMVRGHRVLLIDDVLTTGSTAIECAGALRKAGAESVSLLTACRV